MTSYMVGAILRRLRSKNFQQKVSRDLALGVVVKKVNGVVKSGTPPRTTHWVSGPGPMERSIPKNCSTKNLIGRHFVIGTKGNRPNTVLHLWSGETCA